ncbi:MAG: hypothetical protein FWD78_10830 [Treponema sp.]|nr:hypothetical protein [Treponema sp.]
MNARLQSHFFWGPYGPLSALTGAGFIIMASARLSYAIICAGAFFWTYALTTLVYFSSLKILPARGKPVILLFLSSLVCGLYILLAGFVNPLLVNATWFMMILAPVCCAGSGIFEIESEEITEIFSRVCLESVSLCLVIIALSLIREPIGLGTLSLPGGVWGIFEIFGSGPQTAFFPIRIISVSAGGFILLGFAAALFRLFRNRISAEGDKP